MEDPLSGRTSRPLVLWCICGLALLLVCVSCTRLEPAVEYRLTGVLPSPALPGETVTAVGVFPEEVILSLGDEPLPITPTATGLTFAVPDRTLAGIHQLRITLGNGASLIGSLQIIPRIDAVTLLGQTLVVRGAGWPLEQGTTSAHLSLVVSGHTLQPRLIEGALQASLPEGLPYGRLWVRVVVGGQTSKAASVKREAGSVTGKVTFPAASQSLWPPVRVFIPQAFPTESVSKALIVYYDDAQKLNLKIETLRARLSATLASDEALLTHRSLPLLGVVRLEFASRALARAALARLQGLPGVKRIEWDVPVRLSDAYLGLASEPPVLPGEGQWHLPLTGVPAAWERTRGEGVVVAVLDTGVMLEHPDLAPNLLPGYDFVDGDAAPTDHVGHGTHVAGLVAANGAVLGTAPAASLLPVRVLEGTSGGSAFSVAQGILWAAGLLEELPNPHPAQIINLSLGTASYSAVMDEAVTRALQAGVIIVAATGNSSGAVAYPAALPGVIAVTSLAGPSLAYQPWYANHGAGTSLTAYGGDITQDQDDNGVPDGILSTDLGGYGLRMGTSMAAPQVAGLAALALASGTPAHLVRDALVRTATDLGVLGYDYSFGYGLATGHTATTSVPRSYILALNEENELVSWTLVQSNGHYILNNLPVGEPLRLLALSDENGNTLLGEAGELASPSRSLIPTPRETLLITPLALSPTDGSLAIRLEPRP